MQISVNRASVLYGYECLQLIETRKPDFRLCIVCPSLPAFPPQLLLILRLLEFKYNAGVKSESSLYRDSVLKSRMLVFCSVLLVSYT